MDWAQTSCSSSTGDSFQEVREGLLAVQIQFQEHGQPSKIDVVTKLVSIDEKELGQKVVETGEAIHQDIINIYGLEPVLPKDVATKGLLKVTLILFYFEASPFSLYLLSHVRTC